MKYTILWTKKSTRPQKAAIKQLFGIWGETINGVSDANIKKELEERFLKGAKEGYYKILKTQKEQHYENIQT